MNETAADYAVLVVVLTVAVAVGGLVFELLRYLWGKR